MHVSPQAVEWADNSLGGSEDLGARRRRRSRRARALPPALPSAFRSTTHTTVTLCMHWQAATMAGFAVQVQLARSAIEALGTVVEEARADNLPTAEVRTGASRAAIAADPTAAWCRSSGRPSSCELMRLHSFSFSTPPSQVAAHLQQERLPAMLQEAEQTRRAGQVYRVIDGAVKMLFLMRKRLDT